MKKLITIVYLLLVTATFAQKKSPEITVMSYNIRLNVASDGPNAWPNRKDWVNHLLRFYEADIFGVQEALHQQMLDLSRMSEFAYSGKGRDDGQTAGEYSAIFYKTARFTKLDEGTFWLSDTPEQPSYGWGAQIRRVCSWVKLKDRHTKKTFFVFNTHFDHQSVPARENSAKLITQRVQSIAGNTPVILTGDLNTGPSTPPVQTLLQSFTDTRKASVLPAYGIEDTFTGFNYQDKQNGDRIDYILFKGNFTVLKQGTLTDFNAEQRFPSDHFPVLAKMRLN